MEGGLGPLEKSEWAQEVGRKQGGSAGGRAPGGQGGAAAVAFQRVGVFDGGLSSEVEHPVLTAMVDLVWRCLGLLSTGAHATLSVSR